MTEPLNDDDHGQWLEQTGLLELSELLYWRWDPLGASESFPDSDEEYDAYAPRIIDALRTDGDIDELLRLIERDELELAEAGPGDLDGATRAIHNWYEASIRRWRGREVD